MNRVTAGRASGALVVVLLFVTAIVVVPAPSAVAQDGALQVVPISTQSWVGDDDLIFEVLDAQSVPIVDPDARTSIVLTAPDGTTHDPVTPTVERWGPRGRDLYLARVHLDQVGAWRATVTTQQGDRTLTGAADLLVHGDEGTPALGSAVPDVTTPTMRDARNLMRSITSDPDPISDFYTWSVSELLGAHLPFVLVFDSYLFRPNEACGGALGIVHEIASEFPRVSVVHAEPWVTSYLTGMLTLEPPEGPARLTAAAEAYGLGEPPWVFVVDREGVLRAKLSGVFGTDELRAAMSRVSAE